jgi:hypothetical protein
MPLACQRYLDKEEGCVNVEATHCEVLQAYVSRHFHQSPTKGLPNSGHRLRCGVVSFKIAVAGPGRREAIDRSTGMVTIQ